MKHTPLPWAVFAAGENMRKNYHQPVGILELGKLNVVAGIFGDVKGGFPVTEANAALIVRAVNNYSNLIAALKKCEQRAMSLYCREHNGDGHFGIAKIAREALAAAGEK